MFYAMTLREKDIGKLYDCLQALKAVSAKSSPTTVRGGGQIIEKTREEFLRFARERGAKELCESPKMSEVLGPSARFPKKHTPNLALWTDFVIYRLRKAVLSQFNLDSDDKSSVTDSIELLEDQINQRMDIMRNPFSRLAWDIPNDEATEPVPDAFLSEFIGYRRSANKADVIRFQFNISRIGPPKSRYVEFENIYARDAVPITVTGSGIYVDKTLFMFGHARNALRGSEGYRIQALKLLDNSKGCLIGPVISRDGAGPIASRIVLVRRDKHRWTDDQNGIHDPQRLNQRLIAPPTTENRIDYINDIKANTGHVFEDIFKPDTNLDEDQGIFFFMSNLTDTVIKAIPNIETAIIWHETRLRRVLHNLAQEALDSGEGTDNFSYLQTLQTALAKALEQKKPDGSS